MKSENASQQKELSQMKLNTYMPHHVLLAHCICWENSKQRIFSTLKYP